MKNLILLIVSILMFNSANAGRLQNVDFMSELELDNVGSSKAALLNDTKIYVTTIAKTLDQAIIDGDIGGGGSGDNTNVLLNPQFEDDGDNWTITGGCIASYPVTAELGKTLRLTCTAATFSVKQLSTSLVPFAGQQAAFDLQVKSDANGVKVSSINNSIRNTEYDVIGDDTFKRFKQVGVIADAVNNGLEIFSDVAFTGIVDIDNTYLGLSNLTQELSNISSWKSYTPTLSPAFGSYSNLSARYRRVGGNLEVLASITTGTMAPSIATMTLPPDLVIDSSKLTINNTTAASGNMTGKWAVAENLSDTNGFIITAPSTSTSLVYFGKSSRNGADQLSAGNGNDIAPTSAVFTMSFSVPIVGWAASSTIATQSTELTAKTANEFGAQVSLAGVVSNENYDFIDGNCAITGTGDFQCDYVGGFTTSKLNCTASISMNTDNYDGYVQVTSTTGFKVHTQISSTGASEARDFAVHCSRSADTNKSATIVGSFEQIRSDDLVSVRANTATAIPFPSNSTRDLKYETVIDGTNAGGWYVPSTGIFTSPKATSYLACASYMFSVTGWDIGSRAQLTGVTGNGLSHYIDRKTITTATSYFYQGGGCYAVDLEKDETFSFKLNQNSSGIDKVLFNNSSYNEISITELPTKEAIVANLLADSGMIEKCQTKVLSADVTTVGILGDLTFNNINITKFHSLTVNLLGTQTTGTLTDKYAYLSISGTDVLAQAVRTRDSSTGSMWSILTLSKPIFKPTLNTISFDLTNILNMQVLESLGSSYVTLCQLPETTIETTEF